jgi:hypothetical protein
MEKHSWGVQGLHQAVAPRKKIYFKKIPFRDRSLSLIPHAGDALYTLFQYPRFRVSAALFQYHEEHQYPIRGHVRSYRAGSQSCALSFTESLHHFDFREYKLRPLMVCHSENLRACCTFPFYVPDVRGKASPAYNESHLRSYSFITDAFILFLPWAVYSYPTGQQISCFYRIWRLITV